MGLLRVLAAVHAMAPLLAILAIAMLVATLVAINGYFISQVQNLLLVIFKYT